MTKVAIGPAKVLALNGALLRHGIATLDAAVARAGMLDDSGEATRVVAWIRRLAMAP